MKSETETNPPLEMRFGSIHDKAQELLGIERASRHTGSDYAILVLVGWSLGDSFPATDTGQVQSLSVMNADVIYHGLEQTWVTRLVIKPVGNRMSWPNRIALTLSDKSVLSVPLVSDTEMPKFYELRRLHPQSEPSKPRSQVTPPPLKKWHFVRIEPRTPSEESTRLPQVPSHPDYVMWSRKGSSWVGIAGWSRGKTDDIRIEGATVRDIGWR